MPGLLRRGMLTRGVGGIDTGGGGGKELSGAPQGVQQQLWPR